MRIVIKNRCFKSARNIFKSLWSIFPYIYFQKKRKKKPIVFIAVSEVESLSFVRCEVSNAVKANSKNLPPNSAEPLNPCNRWASILVFRLFEKIQVYHLVNTPCDEDVICGYTEGYKKLYSLDLPLLLKSLGLNFADGNVKNPFT